MLDTDFLKASFSAVMFAFVSISVCISETILSWSGFVDCAESAYPLW